MGPGHESFTHNVLAYEKAQKIFDSKKCTQGRHPHTSTYTCTEGFRKTNALENFFRKFCTIFHRTNARQVMKITRTSFFWVEFSPYFHPECRDEKESLLMDTLAQTLPFQNAGLKF